MSPRPTLVVVGLGPAGPDLVTAGALQAIAAAPPGRRFLRTRRCPAAGALGPCESFDHVYERADAIERVYPEIVERLVAEAAAAERSGGGPVVYAVPGSPTVAERTVELLLADERVRVELHPGLSFVELAWARLGVDPLALGVRLVDGRRFAVEAAGERGPLLVAQCDDRHLLSDIKLAVEDAPDAPVTLLHHLGLADEAVIETPWEDLDRTLEPDHLTSLWIPRLAAPVAAELVRFAELVAALRAGCPWDREQTHHSLRQYLIEEAYEVLEAIDGLDEGPDGPEHLCEELGDLLFQVYFHAVIAQEEGWFTLADVARGVHDKLRARHPHVFGEVQADTAEQVVANWEAIKRAEKGRSSVMDGIPAALPALSYAAKVQRRAETLGRLDGAATVAAAADATGVGERLWALVAEARAAGVDPEDELRAAARRVRDRVRAAELDG
ncbi:MAG: MazG family protein [Acidimicrobiales bacterium]